MAGKRPGDANEVLARLREERERRKAADEPYGTLKEIAAALDVSFGLVSQWETDPKKPGHKKPTDVRRWVKLLRPLGRQSEPLRRVSHSGSHGRRDRGRRAARQVLRERPKGYVGRTSCGTYSAD